MEFLQTFACNSAENKQLPATALRKLALESTQGLGFLSNIWAEAIESLLTLAAEMHAAFPFMLAACVAPAAAGRHWDLQCQPSQHAV
jgi:hypothetical protein